MLEAIFEQLFDDFAFAPKKSEVLQVIRQVLEHPDFRSVSDDDETSPTPDTADHVIYGRLRDDGWIMEVANRKAAEVYMPREAHALLSSLITLKEELKVDISAEASLIDSGIIAAYQDPVGKVMNIASARRQAVQLRRSIDGVLTSLHRIEEDLMRFEGLADLLARFMERFVEKTLLENYNALIVVELTPSGGSAIVRAAARPCPRPRLSKRRSARRWRWSRSSSPRRASLPPTRCRGRTQQGEL